MMMGFKRRFETFVEEGSKTHTIRAKGKRKWKVGMVADCYVDPRQKSMRLLGRFVVTAVDDVRIEFPRPHYPAGSVIALGKNRLYLAPTIYLDGVELDLQEANLFAWHDGFRSEGVNPSIFQFAEFWWTEHKSMSQQPCEKATFHGDLIRWKFEPGTNVDKATRRKDKAA